MRPESGKLHIQGADVGIGAKKNGERDLFRSQTGEGVRSDVRRQKLLCRYNMIDLTSRDRNAKYGLIRTTIQALKE